MRHTVEQLRNMSDYDLNVLAAKTVLNCWIGEEESYWPNTETVCRLPNGHKLYSWDFSRKLDDAAFLVSKVDKNMWLQELVSLVDGYPINHVSQYPEDGVEFDYEAMYRAVTAGARDRTIAAIITAESPYILGEKL